MKVLLLSAGFGTRLKPITYNIPKALIPVCGISLLERNLNYFKNQGFNSIAVNVHHLPDQFYELQAKSSIQFKIFHEYNNIRGTGGALHFARKFLSLDDIFCIANTDILSTVAINQLLPIFINSKSICALIAAPARGKGTILSDPDSTEFCGIANANNIREGVIPSDFIGMAFYRKEALSYIYEDDFSIIPIWSRLQQNMKSVTVIISDNIKWWDTGTPSSWAQIHYDVLEKKYSLNIPSHMIIDYEKKIAYPNFFTDQFSHQEWNHAWIESPKILSQVTIINSIIYLNNGIDNNRNFSSGIFTQWGNLALE